jgi:isopentenyl-diphosphate delta-isomerase
MHRAPDEFRRQLAATFVGWGIPTAESIVLVRHAAPRLMVIASGGLRDGIDVAKCLNLGATLGGLAGPFLKAAAISTEQTVDAIRLILKQLEVSMFAAGAANLADLRGLKLVRT